MRESQRQINSVFKACKIVMILMDEKRTTMLDLAKRFSEKRSSMNRVLRSMEESGIIIIRDPHLSERQPGHNGRPSLVVTLSPEVVELWEISFGPSSSPGRSPPVCGSHTCLVKGLAALNARPAKL